MSTYATYVTYAKRMRYNTCFGLGRWRKSDAAYHDVDEDVEREMREQIDAAERRQDDQVSEPRVRVK